MKSNPYSYFILVLFLFPLSFLRAHDGKDHALQAFMAPHGGSFRSAAGHVLEVYDRNGRLYICLIERDGELPEAEHALKAVKLRIEISGRKTKTFKVGDAGKNACVDIPFMAKKLKLKVRISAEIGYRRVETIIPYQMGSASIPVKIKKKAPKSKKSGWFKAFTAWLTDT